jgi:hypothetical protein
MVPYPGIIEHLVVALEHAGDLPVCQVGRARIFFDDKLLDQVTMTGSSPRGIVYVRGVTDTGYTVRRRTLRAFFKQKAPGECKYFFTQSPLFF